MNARLTMIFLTLVFQLATSDTNASDEMLRGWLISVSGSNLTVQTKSGRSRTFKINSKAVIVSRVKTTTDLKLLAKHSRLQISVNKGEATTIVIEEVPK
jgi:hypothetical protein